MKGSSYINRKAVKATNRGREREGCKEKGNRGHGEREEGQKEKRRRQREVRRGLPCW